MMASTTWQRRDMNTIYDNVGGHYTAVLNDQVWVRGPATYKASWDTLAAGNNYITSRVRNASTTWLSRNGTYVGGDASALISSGTSSLVVDQSSNAIEVWTYSAYTTGSYGGGNPCGIGPDVYTKLILERIA